MRIIKAPGDHACSITRSAVAQVWVDIKHATRYIVVQYGKQACGRPPNATKGKDKREEER